MIIKKNKAVIAAILSAALTVSAVMPTVSAAGTRTKPEKYGDSTYATRFLSLYDDVITNGQENGYLSKNNVASGGFGVPYHCVEELNIEAPDYGHETTSEAMSYIVWMAAMRDNIGKQASEGKIKDADGNAVSATNTNDLEKAWKTMEIMIPTEQTGIWNDKLSAQYSEEHDTPEEYPSAQYAENTGENPIHNKFVQAYKNGGDKGLYLMHWLADVDDWYGYGGGSGKFTFINTFQRGAQESCWETVPHACIEKLQYGMKGTRGVKGVFSTDESVAPQWSYTNAPDAEDRAIQGVYAAERWGVATDKVVSDAGKMGDQLRNNMFDKYYKKIGCQNPQTPGNNNVNSYDGAHYLMSWYTSWGGALDGQWAWQIGASHCHEFYQNPLAAYALITENSKLREGMKAAGAVEDYEKSLQRQLEFYLWLQSEDGPIAGGATSSWHGRYLKYEYLDGVDQEYIDKYGTKTPTTFYDMAYLEHPVYADPGSNHWIGNQVWAVQRLAELYYDVKTNPSATSSKIKAGNLSMEEALKKILDRWVEWFVDNTQLTDDGDYSIPASLDWFGQPKDWTGSYVEKNGVTCKITAMGSADLGCVSSLANTLIWYAKAEGVATEKAYTSKNTDVPSKALHLAHELLDREWTLSRDDIGLTREDSNGNMWRLFEQTVHVPDDYHGTMPNGDPIEPGATFISLRSMYNDMPLVQEYKKLYDGYGKTHDQDPEGLEKEMQKVTLTYHRFWHAGDILLALGTMNELYPDMEVDRNDDGDTKPDLKVDASIEVEVGKTETIKPNITGCTFESADPSKATVDDKGNVTGVAAGETTITVTSPDGQKAEVTVTVKEASTGDTGDTSNTDDTSKVPTGSFDPNEDYIYGDVDLSGSVNVADVTKLAKYFLNSKTYRLGDKDNTPASVNKAMEQANVEYDAAVDKIDLSKLIEHCLGAVPMDKLGPGK